jgi:cell fate (sporulation/competence/biofilm development) regulator YlbF (YheA/YmcA/DUF963 family)
MEELISMARQLGKKLADHERTAKLKAAQKSITDDPTASQLLQDYQKQVEKIHKLEQETKPIEPEDKRLLAELEGKIAANKIFADLTRRQADFVEMMQKVKQAIDNELQV